ncbi:MAG TPA: hypothetical protein VKP60_02780 [Magnetospirillaceae bacterium]|nr:hypothetical protein [Magnetospirillaceae bacterium]
MRGRTKGNGAGWTARPGALAVEGGALYRTGLAGNDEAKAAQGLRQLIGAAESSVAPSGITTEGSSLRQLQLARVFTDCWLTARSFGRPEQWRLAALARAVIGAYDAITLPGGLPEIGEAPKRLDFHDPFAHLHEAERRALDELRRQSRLVDLEILRQDGWLRLDIGAWSGLWHCPPGGWPVQGGLAHHDLGAPELHWNGIPLFVDPGPGRPGGARHGGLSLDGKDPYPETRSYYSESFRHAIAGPAPELRATHDGVRLAMDGFGRFGGHRQIERHWHFDGPAMRLDDTVLGTGRPRIERRLITPWTVEQTEAGLTLSQGEHHLLLTGDSALSVQRRDKLTTILFTARANLPWSGSLSLRPAVAA